MEKLQSKIQLLKSYKESESKSLKPLFTIDAEYYEFKERHNKAKMPRNNLEKYKDPDVRYYACVVDKNRAGAKPRLVFRLNLAYNSWEELGYLRLK